MNIWKRYSMRVSKNWVKFNKMFTLSPWPSPEGEGMTRANTKPLIFTRTTEPTHNQRSLFAPFSHS